MGSHYMILLLLSNFFGGITELVSLLFNKDYSRKENNEEEMIECQIYLDFFIIFLIYLQFVDNYAYLFVL